MADDVGKCGMVRQMGGAISGLRGGRGEGRLREIRHEDRTVYTASAFQFWFRAGRWTARAEGLPGGAAR